MCRSSSERTVSATMSVMEPFVVRLGVGPRWWSWCAPRRTCIDTAVCATTRYRGQRCGETHRALCHSIQHYFEYEQRFWLPPHCRSGNCFILVVCVNVEFVFIEIFAFRPPLGSRSGQVVASAANSFGVCFGADCHPWLALGRCPVERTLVPGGAVALGANGIQGRLCGASRIRWRGASV